MYMINKIFSASAFSLYRQRKRTNRANLTYYISRGNALALPREMLLCFSIKKVKNFGNYYKYHKPVVRNFVGLICVKT